MISFLFEGETTITATAHNGAMAQIPVQVFNPVDAIVLHPEEKDLYAVAGRNTLQITAEIQPGDATHQAPSWKSSNINVLTVDQTGLVTALKPGTAVVTATSTDSLAASATIQITVLARDISEMELQSLEPIVYDAQRHVPALELVLDDNTLVLNTDYTLTGEMTNVGENVLTITGIGKYTGTTEITQTITKAQARIEYVGEDTLWPDTLNRVVSFQPGFVRGTVSYAPILADETTGDSLSAPTDSGDYMLSAAVADTDNYDGATLTRIIHYISGDQLSTLEALTLIPGQTVTLPVTSVLEYADPFALTLASGDEVVATAEGLTVQANSAGSCVLTLSVDGSNATAQCILTVVDSLSTMTLPAALTTVEDEAFADDSAVQRIVLGSEVTSIGNRAFAGMTGLVQIEIPESVTSIEDDALNGSDPLILCKRGSYADQWAEANGIDRIYN